MVMPADGPTGFQGRASTPMPGLAPGSSPIDWGMIFRMLMGQIQPQQNFADIYKPQPLPGVMSAYAPSPILPQFPLPVLPPTLPPKVKPPNAPAPSVINFSALGGDTPSPGLLPMSQASGW